MNLPGYIRDGGKSVLLSVKLQPRASANEICHAIGDELRIRVTAPPVDAAANEALLKLLARVLECPRGQVALVKGQTSRHKTIRIAGLDAATVLARFRAAMPG